MKKSSYIKKVHFEIYDDIIPAFRLAVITVVSVIFLKARLTMLYPLDIKNTIMYAYLVYSLILLVFKKIRKPLAYNYPLALPVADMSLLTLVIIFTGGAESPCYIFYVLFIAFLSISFGLKLSAIGSLVGIAYYTAAILIVNGYISVNSIIRIVFLLVFAVFTGLIDEKIHKHTYSLAVRDSLTSLYNYQYFYNSLENLMNESRRASDRVSLAIIDVDDFKMINDKCGHLEGDRVLMIIADKIRSGIRSEDIAARYGGDELVIIFPQTDKQSAVKICERIGKNITDRLANGFEEKITISVGVATFPYDGPTPPELFNSADRALLDAKQAGKNTIR